MNEHVTDPTAPSNKTPEAKIELGNIRAVIYRTETERNGAFYSVSFERTYADKDGNARVAYGFRESDFDRLEKVVRAARQELAQLTPTKDAEPEPELRIVR